MLTRLDKNRRREFELKREIMDNVAEVGLHHDIIKYCRAQYPPWKYIHSRPDKRSTIATGCHDFTIFLPGGRVLCFECKDATGKLDSDQLIWRKELELLGHTVHIVRSMRDFFALL